jgi:hypothetical protein
MNVFLRTSLLGLLALPLAAQSSGFSAGGAIIYGFDSLKKVTNSNLGFTINGAFDTTIYGSDVPARISLAYANMPGKQTSYSTPTTDGHLRTTLNLIQLSGDILVASSAPGLKGVFGISFNKYSLNQAGNEDTTAANAGVPSAHFPLVDDKGVKLGLRLGAEYTITKQISAEVLFQQTELAGSQLNDKLVRKGGLNPAWLQFGARYHF